MSVETPHWMLDGRLERALELWNEGLSCLEIARRIGHGCTSDAVIGKARRAHWPPHPHPPLGMETRAALKADPRTARNTETQRERRAAQRAQQRNEWGETPMVVACEPQKLAVPTATFSRCQWPITEIPPHRFCDAPVPGKGPYCEQHRARSRERRPSVRDAWVSAA
jgi:hypothetical protein